MLGRALHLTEEQLPSEPTEPVPAGPETPEEGEPVLPPEEHSASSRSW